jgi:mannitol/fructose-specific phosphotransferase system IIA component (Ntr-type)
VYQHSREKLVRRTLVRKHCARHIAQREIRLIQGIMDLEDLFGGKRTPLELKAKTRWEAIEELIEGLVRENKINRVDEQAIKQAVRKRESAMTTGIGTGVALPHARTPQVSKAIATVGYSRQGIDFESIDGQPVTLVCLYLIPQDQSQQHLHTLANLARLLPSLRKQLCP